MEKFSYYQLGGIALAVCPIPKFGREPNHDIFHSSVSCNSLSSSGEKCSNVATALVKCSALKKTKKSNKFFIFNDGIFSPSTYFILSAS